MDRVPLVRRAVFAERSVLSALAWTVAAIFLPTFLRWVIDRGESGIPFVTYFPAVLLVSVLLGWRYGALTALASAVLANRLLRPDPFLWPFTGTDLLIIALFLISCCVIVFAGETLRRLVRQQEQARQTEEILKREILHRVKNMLTIIQAIAIMTSKNSPPEEFADTFANRIQALDRANALLGSNADSPQDVTVLVERTVEPFAGTGAFITSGPAFPLPQSAIVPLSMALHELCTNAVKYGALSMPGGRVSITWESTGTDNPELTLQWKETGGPVVKVPERRGLGTVLLMPRIPIREAQVEFLPTGVECRIVVMASEP